VYAIPFAWSGNFGWYVGADFIPSPRLPVFLMRYCFCCALQQESYPKPRVCHEAIIINDFSSGNDLRYTGTNDGPARGVVFYNDNLLSRRMLEELLLLEPIISSWVWSIQINRTLQHFAYSTVQWLNVLEEYFFLPNK
jgi:hypothetical protein